MSFINFEKESGKKYYSHKEIEEKLLEHDQKKDEVRKEKIRDKFKSSLSLDNQWMLPNLSKRLGEDGGEPSRSKRHKKKSKRRASSSSDSSLSNCSLERKKKKSKKTKRKRRKSSSSSDRDAQWVEKKEDVKNQPPARDDWMNVDTLVPTFDRKKEEKPKKEVNKCIVAAPGQSDRELNPYWKDGGTGLPSEVKDLSVTSSSIGDRGLEWYERALKRAQEQAEEEGRSLADVVSERWGSLEKLMSLISEAKSTRHERYRGKDKGDRDRRPAFRKPGEEYGRTFSDKHDNRERKWKKGIEERGDRSRDDKHNREEKSDVRDYKLLRKDESGEFKRSSGSRNNDSREPASKPLTSNEAKSVPTNQESAPKVGLKVLTDEEINSLAAKLVKAEIMGKTELVEKLKKTLEEARLAREKASQTAEAGGSSQVEETVVLLQTNRQGVTRPVQRPTHPEPARGRRKQQKMETHSGGQRMRYFADDDQRDLKEMFEREKLSSGDDDKALFLKMAVRRAGAGSDEEDAAFADAARMAESSGKIQQREMGQAVKEAQRRRKTLDNCPWCLDSPQRSKHLLVSIGETCYMCLPAEESLTPLHCLIVPVQHAACGTQLDEDVWEEMHRFRRAVVAMASACGQDVIFFEQARLLKNLPHMVLHCVVLEKEIGDMAPIYFKKALLDSESEWANNKKVVDIKGADVRRSVPKGLPYFAVEFPPQGGFAHVIEDVKDFPHNFAHSVIGGMLDLDHRKWRKPQKSTMAAQREKTVAFSKKFSKYDFTVKQKAESSSSSSSSQSASSSSDSD